MKFYTYLISVSATFLLISACKQRETSSLKDDNPPKVFKTADFITGESNYCTPCVLAHLGLAKTISETQNKAVVVKPSFQLLESTFGDAKQPDAVLYQNMDQIKTTSAIDLGGGYSGVMPYFNRIGLKTVALDIGYGEPSTAVGKAYEKTFDDNLLKGDMRDLTSAKKLNGVKAEIPAKNYGLVMSHAVMNYFLPDENFKPKPEESDEFQAVILEMMRVLRSGGTARFNIGLEHKDSALQKLKNLSSKFNSFDYSILKVKLTCESALKPGETYPSDSFDWPVFQDLVFSREAPRDFLEFKGRPLPMERYDSEDILVVLTKK